VRQRSVHLRLPERPRACATADASCALPALPLRRAPASRRRRPGLRGRRRRVPHDRALGAAADDGSTFRHSDTTLDFCGIELQDVECGGATGLCESNIPRSVVFLCATFLGNGVIDETAVPDANWLKYSNFPPTVAQAIKDAFPGRGRRADHT
jgi:hypothetical protein